MDTFNPAEASGETAIKGVRTLELNEVSLNGDGDAKEIAPGKFERAGGYFRKRMLVGNPKDAKPQEIDLGRGITLVFLKVRRRLVERGNDGKIVRSTGEHNSPQDIVTLYETATSTKLTGTASALRTQFPNLRTVQVVYSLLVTPTKEPELVRFVVKGASLGSDAKAEGVMDFYQYISSFTGDDHFYQFKTVLTPILEEGKKTYFAIKFERGDKLSEASYTVALVRMREVHENCVEVDKQRAARMVRDGEADIHIDGSMSEPQPEVEYPTEEINPDEIPFN